MSERDRKYVYKLTERGMKVGRHSVSVQMPGGPAVNFKIEKNGVVKVPFPGIPHPDAHDLVYMGYEGDGNGNYVDGALVEKHQKIKAAEDALKAAKETLALAEDVAKKAQGDAKQGAKEDVEAARAMVNEAQAALDEANKK